MELQRHFVFQIKITFTPLLNPAVQFHFELSLIPSVSCTTVVHKLRPIGQIRPAKSRQVARKVQQESLKYEKHGISFIA